MAHPAQVGSLKVVGGRQVVSKARTDPKRKTDKESGRGLRERCENNGVVVENQKGFSGKFCLLYQYLGVHFT